MLFTATHGANRHSIKTVVWLCLCCMALLMGAAAEAASEPDPWRIDDLAVLADPGGNETIATISQAGRTTAFQPVPHGFSAGYTRTVHWLRFTLHAPPPNAKGERQVLLEIHPPYLDDLQLFIAQPDAPASFDIRRSGDLLPFTQREVHYRAFVHRIAFSDARPRVVYVRLQTTSSSALVLKDWEPQRFVDAAMHEYALLGAFFGVLIVGLMVNFWYGLKYGEPLYRRFLLYLGSTLLFLLSTNGLIAELLLPAMPLWVHHWTSVSLILSMVSGAHFYRLALDIDAASPWMRWVYRAMFWLALIALPAPFLDLYPEAIRILLPVLLVMLASGSWRSMQLWKGQTTGGKLLLAAHLFSLFGSLSGSLTLMGFLPGSLWLIYGFQIGTIGALLALQIMLTKRMRSIEAGHAQARAAIAHERAQHEHQRRFLAMLTHELKTPLSVIRMRLGAAQPSARMQTHAQTAVADIDAIVERVALSSRIEDNDLPQVWCHCRLDEILAEILDRQTKPERVMLSLAKEVVTPGLYTDPLLLRTVVGNLIDNALKYSPVDSIVRITVVAHCHASMPGWRIRVENPVGSAGRPDPARVFEKYYRATGAHDHSGSGLGLYIVQSLTTLLHGQLRYLTNLREICFELWIPIKAHV